MNTLTKPHHPAAAMLAAHLELIGKDMQRWIELFADDAVVVFPYAPSLGRPDRLVGKAAIDGYFRGTPGIFRELAFRDLRLHPALDPELAIAEVHGSALIATTGKRYEQDYVLVLRTREGRISSYREYWNPMPALEAFGGAEGIPAIGGQA